MRYARSASWHHTLVQATALLALLFCTESTQAAPLGNPPVASFRPALDVYPQNFDVTYGVRDDILVANEDGILIFNGERWSLLEMPNGDMVRSLSAPVLEEAGNRVYVGGYDQFGYVEMQANGEYRFVDLGDEFSGQIPEGGFADIWEIIVSEQGVLFRAVDHAFFYDPQDPQRRLAWHRDSRYGAAFLRDGKIYMPFRGDQEDAGLYVLVGDAWQPAEKGESFNDLAYHWMELEDGRHLALKANGSWQAYGDEGATEVKMPAGFPASSVFSDGAVMTNGTLVLTSDDGKLYFLDLSKGTYRSQKISNKYLSGIHASDSGLLLVDDAAVHHVTWPARWTVLDESQGIVGSLHGISRWGDSWMLLGSSGIQESAIRNGDVRFESRDWTDHEAWDLLVLDDNRAILAESYELKLLTRAEGKVIIRSLTDRATYPRLVRQSRFDPQLLFVGTELGFIVFRMRNDKFDNSSVQIITRLENLNAPGVNSMVERKRGDIWFGSERGGVFRLKLTKDFNELDSLDRFGSEAGLSYGQTMEAEVRQVDEQLVVSTEAGIFTWNGNEFERGAFESLLEAQDSSERLSLRESPTGELWAFDYRQLFRQDENGNWIEELRNEPIRGAIGDVIFNGKDAVVVASDSILEYQGLPEMQVDAPGVRLTRVQQVNGEDKPRILPIAPSEPVQFSQGNVSLYFAFALPGYNAVESASYSARLYPLEKEFSEWSATSAFTYFRLAPGEYTFEVRARDAVGNISSAAPYRVYVKPSWFNSIEARTAWLLFAILLVFLVSRQLVQRRLRRLRKDKIHLEKMVASRTRELESANRQLQAMAHLDGLTEIANRRRLDEYLGEVWQQCKEHDRPLSLLVIDVDHFKQFNDRFGHVAGDRLLQNLARKLSQSLRRSEDLVARYGGEEFLVVLPGARLEAACELAETMREQIEVSSLGATISIGVATGMHASTGSVTALVNAADQALYAAKESGRNCVRAAED